MTAGIMTLGFSMADTSSKWHRRGPAVEVWRQDIHQQDGEGYPFGHAAEQPDQGGQQAAADSEDNFAPAAERRRDIIGRHEKSTKEKAAGENVIKRVLTKDRS